MLSLLPSWIVTLHTVGPSSCLCVVDYNRLLHELTLVKCYTERIARSSLSENVQPMPLLSLEESCISSAPLITVIQLKSSVSFLFDLFRSLVSITSYVIVVAQFWSQLYIGAIHAICVLAIPQHVVINSLYYTTTARSSLRCGPVHLGRAIYSILLSLQPERWNCGPSFTVPDASDNGAWGREHLVLAGGNTIRCHSSHLVVVTTLSVVRQPSRLYGRTWHPRQRPQSMTIVERKFGEINEHVQCCKSREVRTTANSPGETNLPGGGMDVSDLVVLIDFWDIDEGNVVSAR